MAKPSVSESGATPQASARDSHGNQSHGEGSHASASAASSASSASREIFQGLFKDLGKQAMAMESILRLVCGKVDKLEHWVTEMSFGMTELDLKLRNIAHNIEGTAANVDDVASVSRWAVPAEDDPLDAKAATATVIKKVGVGLNKKKQMRMTGMVANILDQLTTVAETPVMVESESEAHKGEDGKKKKGKKTKDREKAKARGEHGSGGGEAVLSSKEDSPREAETKSEAKEKHKTHKKKKSEQHQQQHTESHEEAVDEKPQEQDAAAEVPKVEKVEPLPHDVVEAKADEVKAEEGVGPHEETVHTDDLKEDAHPHDDVKEGETEDKAEGEDVTATDHDAHEANIHETTSKEEAMSATDAHQEIDEQREKDKPVDIEPIPEVAAQVEAAHEENSAEIEPPEGHQDDEQTTVEPPVEVPQASAPEEVVVEEERPIEAELAPTTAPIAMTPTATDSASASSPVGHDTVPQPTETQAKIEVPAVLAAPSLESTQSPRVERASMLSPIPSSRASIDEAVAQVTTSPSEPAAASPAPQPPSTAATRPDLPTIRLEPLVIHNEVASPEPAPPNHAAPDSNSTAETPSAASNEPFQPAALRTKASSKKLRNKNAPTATEGVAESGARPSPSKKGSRKASIRQSISQRQPSLKKRRSQMPPPEPPVITEDAKTEATASLVQPTIAAVTEKPPAVEAPSAKLTPVVKENAQRSQEEGTQEDDDEDDDEDDEDDEDDDDEDSSVLSSDSDGSVLDLGGSGNSRAAAGAADANSTPADKKMSSKMTRTLTALNKLKKANVLSPDEIAELKQRATQKWYRLRDHVKEKNKKDVTNILLKRKKNIFTVSNRIELLEEKSREVYASIKQLNTELKSKIEASAVEGMRRQVQDINASLQVLDQKISKGDIPTMDNIKQLASETENLRLMFLEQLAFARDHCDANHDETLKMFEDEWKRVAEMQKTIEDKLDTLAAGFDDKILALPDYADALEGIRRAIRKKADLKMLRELEAKLLGHDGESEDCLIRCLSCHKEVTNANGHDATNNGDDTDVSVASSPHFKRVNPGTVSAKVYRSNMPLNAQPLVISESTPELFALPQTDEVTAPNAKSVTPSRRAIRNDEPRPSPLSFIHVTATRAMAAAADASRPISAPSVAVKKKTQPTSAK